MAERKKLRDEFGELFDKISEILFRHDPIHINFDFNTDEYEPEVGAILSRQNEFHLIADVQKVAHEEFVKWFSLEDAGEASEYKAIAEEIWEAWRDFKFPWVKAEVTFLPASEGGRISPLNLNNGTYYRPHIVVGNSMQREAILIKGNILDEEYLGVQFRPCDKIISPGESTNLKLELMYYPAVEYKKLILGTEFTIREGAKIIGYGKVLEVGYGEINVA